MVKKKVKVKAKCIITKCTRKEVTRGLCPTCYTAARKLVEASEVSWVDLEQKKLAKPKPSPVSVFMEQFRANFKSKVAKQTIPIRKSVGS